MENTIALLVIFLVFALIYFYPSIVAYYRKHRQTQAIITLNIFLGWTFVGWVAALVWSLTDDTRERLA